MRTGLYPYVLELRQNKLDFLVRGNADLNAVGTEATKQSVHNYNSSWLPLQSSQALLLK